MQSNLQRRRPFASLGLRLLLGAALSWSFCAPTACVTTDVETGRVIPRGNQKLPFEEVEKAADKLKVGMNKTQVLLLLGSPAEMDDEGALWIYLPERYAVLIPARALRLEFRDGILAEYGYRAIVLGTRL